MFFKNSISNKIDQKRQSELKKLFKLVKFIFQNKMFSTPLHMIQNIKKYSLTS